MISSLYKYPDHQHVRDAWDALQCRVSNYALVNNALLQTSLTFQMGCCGINGYTDWGEFNIEMSNGTMIPESCQDAYGEPFEFGCWQQLVYTVSQSALLVGTAAICVAIVQVGPG